MNCYFYLVLTLGYGDEWLSNLTQDYQIKCASEWSGVLSSERVCAAIGSANRVAKAGY